MAKTTKTPKKSGDGAFKFDPDNLPEVVGIGRVEEVHTVMTMPQPKPEPTGPTASGPKADMHLSFVSMVPKAQQEPEEQEETPLPEFEFTAKPMRPRRGGKRAYTGIGGMTPGKTYRKP